MRREKRDGNEKIRRERTEREDKKRDEPLRYFFGLTCCP
jgi:hypothetical protein